MDWEHSDRKMKMLKGNKTVKYTSKDGKVKVILPKGLKKRTGCFAVHFEEIINEIK